MAPGRPTGGMPGMSDIPNGGGPIIPPMSHVWIWRLLRFAAILLEQPHLQRRVFPFGLAYPHGEVATRKHPAAEEFKRGGAANLTRLRLDAGRHDEMRELVGDIRARELLGLNGHVWSDERVEPWLRRERLDVVDDLLGEILQEQAVVQDGCREPAVIGLGEQPIRRCVRVARGGSACEPALAHARDGAGEGAEDEEDAVLGTVRDGLT